MPRYFAVFFNPNKSKVLSEKEVRVALNYATNKKEISSGAEEKIVHSPILPKIYGFEEPQEIYHFDLAMAKSILEEAGFKDENQDGFREKVIKRLMQEKISNVEVLTTDTHSVNGLTPEERGYHPVGEIDHKEVLVKYAIEVAEESNKKVTYITLPLSPPSRPDDLVEFRSL